MTLHSSATSFYLVGLTLSAVNVYVSHASGGVEQTSRSFDVQHISVILESWIKSRRKVEMDRIEAQEVVQGMVAHEQCRQEQLKAQGRFDFTPFDQLMLEPQKLACLIEELGEIAKCVLSREYLTHDTPEERTDKSIIAELTQLAALTHDWMERIVVNNHNSAFQVGPIDVQTGDRRGGVAAWRRSLDVLDPRD